MTGKVLKKAQLDPKTEMTKMSQASPVFSEPQKVVRADVPVASQQAQQILQEANQEARRIKDEARNLALRVQAEMEKAKLAGVAQGREEGLAQVTSLILEAKRLKEVSFTSQEKEVLGLIYDIAEKIIGHELKTEDSAILSRVRQALDASMGQKLILLVNPADYPRIQANHAHIVQAVSASKVLEIRSAENVNPLSCRVETELGTIDADLETQLSAVRKVLGL